MHSDTGFLLTIVVLCYAVVSGVVRRWYVAPALIFVVIGIALGPSTLGLTEDGRGAEGFIVLAQLALTVILFNQASMLDLRHVFSRGHLDRVHLEGLNHRFNLFQPVQVVFPLRLECKCNLSFSKPLVILSVVFQGCHGG